MKNFLVLIAMLLLFAANIEGATTGPQIQLSIQNNEGPGGNGQLSINLQLLILFTVLSLAPSLLIMTTAFVRILIVLSFLRSGLSLQQPSNQVIISLALFITFFIMQPTFNRLETEVVEPMNAGKLTADQAFSAASNEMKTFMLKYTRAKDLALFMSMSNPPVEAGAANDLPITVVTPAFMLSELQTGFQMGLLILLPFLVIDLVVASILMSMGMMMLPPPIVSLPLKIMVFVLVDGWTLVVHALVQSFQ